jgi:hypothetical protein
VPALGPPEVAGEADADADAAAEVDGAAAAVVGAALDAGAGVFLLLEQAASNGLVNASVVAPKPAARRKFRRLMAAWTTSGWEEGSTMTSTIWVSGRNVGGGVLAVNVLFQ